MPAPSSTANTISGFRLDSQDHQYNNICRYLSPQEQKRSKRTSFASHWPTQRRIYCSTRVILFVTIVLTDDDVSLFHVFKQWFVKIHYDYSSSPCISESILITFLVSGSTANWRMFYFIPISLLSICRPSVLFPPAVSVGFDIFLLHTHGFWRLPPSRFNLSVNFTDALNPIIADISWHPPPSSRWVLRPRWTSRVHMNTLFIVECHFCYFS